MIPNTLLLVFMLLAMCYINYHNTTGLMFKLVFALVFALVVLSIVPKHEKFEYKIDNKE